MNVTFPVCLGSAVPFGTDRICPFVGLLTVILLSDGVSADSAHCNPVICLRVTSYRPCVKDVATGSPSRSLRAVHASRFPVPCRAVSVLHGWSVSHVLTARNRPRRSSPPAHAPHMRTHTPTHASHTPCTCAHHAPHTLHAPCTHALHMHSHTSAHTHMPRTHTLHMLTMPRTHALHTPTHPAHVLTMPHTRPHTPTHPAHALTTPCTRTCPAHVPASARALACSLRRSSADGYRGSP